MENEILITGLAYGGEGVGRCNGKVCFICNALPGEKVKVKVIQQQKKILKARAIKWLEFSPERVQPPCPHYEICGGCQYQHVSYKEELAWKEKQVGEYLKRNLRIDEALTGKIMGSSEPYGYRSSVTMHQNAAGLSGFVSRDNRTVTPIENCLLLNPALKGLFKNPWAHKKEESRTFRLNSENRPMASSSDEFFEVQVGKEKIMAHTRCFFQNNLEITAKIGDQIERWVQNSSPEVFIDLYCGVGTFTFLSAGDTPSLMMAEENPWAVKALRKNLKARGKSAEILEGQVENKFQTWISSLKNNRAFLFTDPPRQGMDEKLAFSLAKTPFSEIAYLSCHLGSLTRDLKILMEKGGFKIKAVLPFDMFPRTKHIEILTLLTR